jgi:hypothetical protein
LQFHPCRNERDDFLLGHFRRDVYPFAIRYRNKSKATSKQLTGKQPLAVDRPVIRCIVTYTIDALETDLPERSTLNVDLSNDINPKRQRIALSSLPIGWHVSVPDRMRIEYQHAILEMRQALPLTMHFDIEGKCYCSPVGQNIAHGWNGAQRNIVVAPPNLGE